MRVTHQPLRLDSELYSSEFGVERSLGCHLMDIVKYIVGRKYPERAEEATQASFTAGFLCEHMMAAAAIVQEERNRTKTRVYKPGQMMWCYQCSDVHYGREASEEHLRTTGHVGIFLSPDGQTVLPLRGREWKLTKRSRRSAGSDLDDHPKIEHITLGYPDWIYQFMGYAYALEVPATELDVIFVEGDYGLTTRDYLPLRYLFEYEEGETGANWDVLVDNAIGGGLLTP